MKLDFRRENHYIIISKKTFMKLRKIKGAYEYASYDELISDLLNNRKPEEFEDPMDADSSIL